MERQDNHTEGFENFLKEKADQYKLYPSDKVWTAIHDNLHSRTRWSYLAVTVIFLGLGIGGKVFDARQNNLASRVILNTLHAVPSAEFTLAGKTESIGTGARSPLRIAHSVHWKKSLTDHQRLEIQHSAEQFAAGPEPSQNIKAADQYHTGLGTLANSIAEPYLAGENGEQTQLHIPRHITSDQVRTMPLEYNSQPATVNLMEGPAESGMNGYATIPVMKSHSRKLGLQLYFSPTVSYRKLSGTATKSNNFNNYPSVYSANLGYPGDVNNAVNHKALMGMELGTALVYKVSDVFRLKAGLQLNLNQYDIQAYGYSPEIAPLSAAGIGHTQINAVSVYRNFNGFYQTWLRNQHVMVSVPLGAELTLFGSKNVQFNIAGTIQPTYNFNNQSYMISTNLKNYAQDPSLFRDFNLNTAMEAFLSINTGSMRWNIGPQFRYQVLSSYKSSYPISEHLIDYGFKVGVTKTLK